MQSEFEELAAKSLKDRQALLAAQSELEAANASKVRESGAAMAGLHVLTDRVLEWAAICGRTGVESARARKAAEAVERAADRARCARAGVRCPATRQGRSGPPAGPA